MATTISFGLSQKEVNEAIKEVKSYKRYLQQRCEILCMRLAEIGLGVARVKVSESNMGNFIQVKAEQSTSMKECRAVVFAVGDIKNTQNGQFSTVLAVEFGAGIKYNANANPKAGELGYGVGTFPNQTHAFDENGWYYMDENGDWHHSYGVKATMPMYNASIEMIQNVQKIAKEVFK